MMPKRPRSSNQKIKKIPKSCSATPFKKIKLNNSNLNSIRLNMHDKIEILNTPVKSANDRKEYKVIRLENGLIACLISEEYQNLPNSAVNNQSDSEGSYNQSDSSDTESDSSDESSDSENNMNNSEHLGETEEKMAAASLCIGVGSFSDPETIPGMAHFLEHMVFMGSEKYPEENDFDSYLRNRGGTSNASTDCETTVFFYECLEKHVHRSLDKFAQFFISPLMKRDAMTREREAIDSEFQMALPSDTHRKEQLVSSLARTGTPVNKFSWGNLITLRDNVSDDILYEGVHEFRKRHYSAHRMTLAIQARLPLEELESYVVECFAAVPCNNIPANGFEEYADNVFNTPQFRRMYYVKPMKDICQVEITFPLPSLLGMYKSKPQHYISWLFGHEGKGSLLSYLQKKFWALAIYTGNSETGMEHNTMYSLFTVNLVLTPKGLNHIFEVLEAMFSYINFLKEVGPQERIYNEIKTIEDTSFRYKEEVDPIDFVENLAEVMQFYPPEDYLTGESLYFEYKPDLINMVMEKLNPNNMNIIISSSVTPSDIEYDKKEKWFSTLYTDRDIPVEWIEKWLSVNPMECFKLPEVNQFLAVNFDLLDLNKQRVPLYPEKILDTELVELWYKPDNKFKLPVAYMNYYFINPLIIESAVNASMADLFTKLLIIQLTEEAYPAHAARLSYSIKPADVGIVVKVEGYNEKLPLLLKLIIKYMKDFANIFSEELFNAVKDKQRKSYYNSFLKPSELARSTRLSILINQYYTSIEKHRQIKNVTYEMFKMFAVEFLKDLHIQALVQGNISKDIILKTNNELISILDCTALSCNISKVKRTRQIPIGKYCCKIMSFNVKDCNSAITNYYQYDLGDLRTMIIIEIFMLIMEEPLFDCLRTKEQLGYHVHCDLSLSYGVLGYSITVNTQAQKNTSEFIDQRIESFIKYFAKLMKKMSHKKIGKIKNDLIKIKQLGDTHLEDEVSKNWSEIQEQDMMFDRRIREIAVINDLKISDIINWIDNFLNNHMQRRKLSIQIVGHVTPEKNTIESNSPITCNNIDPESNLTHSQDNDQYEIITANHFDEEFSDDQTLITDLNKFKSDLFLLPAHKITK